MRLVPLLVVTVLELLGLLLIAAAAAVAAWTYVGLWAGLAAAGVVVLIDAWLLDRRLAPPAPPKQ